MVFLVHHANFPSSTQVGCMDPDACAVAHGWRRDLHDVEMAVSDVMESYDLDPVTAKAG